MTTIAAAFRRHQSAILDQIDETRSLLVGDPCPPKPALDGQRAVIGDALADYQSFKHGEVYNPIIAGGSADAPAAAALKADCLSLSESYDAYRALYDPEPGPDRAADREATLDMTTTVTLALIREFELVQQLDIYRILATKQVGGA